MKLPSRSDRHAIDVSVMEISAGRADPVFFCAETNSRSRPSKSLNKKCNIKTVSPIYIYIYTYIYVHIYIYHLYHDLYHVWTTYIIYNH